MKLKPLWILLSCVLVQMSIVPPHWSRILADSRSVDSYIQHDRWSESPPPQQFLGTPAEEYFEGEPLLAQNDDLPPFDVQGDGMPTEEQPMDVARDYVVIMAEDFEGGFPSPGWVVIAESGYADVYWDDVGCRGFSGRSAWCAALGSEAPSTDCSTYVPNMRTWMIYGPFDLADATEAYFDYKYWIDCEPGIDYLFIGASTDGQNFRGLPYDQPAYNWPQGSIDFSDVGGVNMLGEPNVWVGILFQSDFSIEYEGAYVDDLAVIKFTSASGSDLEVMSVTVESGYGPYPPGAQISMLVQIRNNGPDMLPAYGMDIDWYASENQSITPQDYYLCTIQNYDPLAAGYTRGYEAVCQLSNVPEGWFYIGCIVSATTDPDESNNVR
jgi:hypothetical protein